MPKSVKYIFLAITSIQQNLIVETSQSTMLCKITFQLQNVFNNFLFDIICFVVDLVFKCKFKVSLFTFLVIFLFSFLVMFLFSFLVMFLFWLLRVNLSKVNFISFASQFVSAPQSWGVSENFHNQIFLLSTHFHFLSTPIISSFIPVCPLLSLSLSLPVPLAAAVAD